MCDPSLGMPLGGECDPTAGSYEQQPGGYAGAPPPGHFYSQPVPHTSYSPPSYCPQGMSETREIRQTFVYHPNTSRSFCAPRAIPPPSYPCHQHTSSNPCGPSAPVQVEPYPTFGTYRIVGPGMGHCRAAAGPNRCGSCPSVAVTSYGHSPAGYMQPPPCSAAYGYTQGLQCGRSMPYASYFNTGCVAPQPRHVLF